MLRRRMQTFPAFATAPASVSNLACGFDVLGFAIEGPRDRVGATALDAAPGGDLVVIRSISGDAGRLPREAGRNTAGVAAAYVLRAAGSGRGVALDIAKGIPLASGLGSSAASAVAAAVATNAVLGLGLPRSVLIGAAVEAERLVASGSAHADNVAPSLCGGLVLLRGEPTDPEIVPLPVPKDLFAAVVHPHMEIRTSEARAALGDSIALGTATRQWSNLAALVDALHRSDFGLLSRALVDEVAEPVRRTMIPGFDAVKAAALGAGALGCSISGAGPSVFALSRGETEARRAGEAMRNAFEQHGGLPSDVFVSVVGAPGARVESASREGSLR